jgi:hypothetical protein
MTGTRSFVRPLAVALVLALLTQNQALAAGAHHELAEGVWVANEADRVYLSNAQGFPEARELEDGRLLWTATEPAVLIWHADARWLALGQSGKRGEGRLLLIDAASGAVQQRIDFALPDAVSAAVSAEPLRRFDVRAERMGDGVRLHWSYVAHPLRGALLASDGGAVASEGVELQGVVDVDLASARPMARARGDARLAELGERQFRAADDAHAMASESKPDPTFGTVWRWQLASRSEGILDAQLDLPFSYAPFLVSKQRLIYRAPALGYRQPSGAWQHAGLRLVVNGLESGRELWSVEVLDREFRGVLPP